MNNNNKKRIRPAVPEIENQLFCTSSFTQLLQSIELSCHLANKLHSCALRNNTVIHNYNTISTVSNSGFAFKPSSSLITLKTTEKTSTANQVMRSHYFRIKEHKIYHTIQEAQDVECNKIKMFKILRSVCQILGSNVPKKKKKISGTY